jgi:hypothetical protein
LARERRAVATVLLPALGVALAGAGACGRGITADLAGAADTVVVSYVVQGGVLYAVNETDGMYTRTALSYRWGAPASIAHRTSSEWVHIIADGGLWRASARHDARMLLGQGDWSGPAQMDWNASTGKLYIVQADRLYSMDDADNTGSYTILGEPAWTNTTSMTSYGDSLYIISNSQLYRVTANTGARTALSGPIWTGPTRMTKQFWGLSGALYVVQAGALHEVDPNDGSFEVIGRGGWWSATTSMSCHYEAATFTLGLYIIDSSEFLRVDSAGKYYDTGMGKTWEGPTVSAGTGCTY